MTFHADRNVHILIVGGGAIGTSLAYHLARDGAKDVLLVEKAQLTHGCTWHAAGLVGQLRGKRNLTRLMQNSVAVFDRLLGLRNDVHQIRCPNFQSGQKPVQSISLTTEDDYFDFLVDSFYAGDPTVATTNSSLRFVLRVDPRTRYDTTVGHHNVAV
mgnify:CR=1 FL=1